MGFIINPYFDKQLPGFDLTKLKSYWKFNESSGDIINLATSVGSTDSLGTAADIQITGATFGATGIIDDALSFDGVNDKGDIGTSTTQFKFFMEDQRKVTVVYWYKYLTATRSVDKSIFDTSNTGTGTGVLIQHTRTATNDVWRWHTFIAGVSEDDMKSSNGFVPADTNFHMIMFTVDDSLGSNQMKVSIDDGAADTFTSSGNDSTNAHTAADLAQLNTGIQNMDAIIDEFSIWNRVLTDAERTSLFNAGSGLEL